MKRIALIAFLTALALGASGCYGINGICKAPGENRYYLVKKGYFSNYVAEYEVDQGTGNLKHVRTVYR